MKWMRGSGVLLALCCISSPAWAQVANTQSDARDYEALAWLPNNTVAALAYFRHVSTSDGQDLSVNQGVFRANYILKFGNLAVVPFDATLPIVDVAVYNATPSGATLYSSGIADATYLPTVGYIVNEDEATHTHTYVAFTPYITAPTGTYDTSKVVNIGDHRWRIQPQVAVGQRFAKAFTFDLVGSAAFYTTNNEFVVPGPTGLSTAPLKQDPTIGMEAHLGMDLSPTMWVSASYYLAAVGKRTLSIGGADVQADQAQTTHTLRFNYAIHIEKGTLALLQYDQDIAASGGAPIERFVGARISHVFF